MDGRLHCPIVGLYLSLADQKEILRKAGFSAKKLSPYEIHQALLAGIGEKGALAQRIQRKLDAEYRQEIAKWAVLPADEMASVWKKQVTQEEIEGALWVAAAHHSLPEEVMDEIWTDVHLFPYLKTQQRQEILHQNEKLQAANKGLSEKQREVRNQIRTISKALHAAKKAAALQDGKIQSLLTENKALKGNVEIQVLRDENTTLAVRLKKTDQQFQGLSAKISELDAKNKELASRLDSESRVNQALQEEVRALLREKFLDKPECENCSNYDLCARRVLLVGGITKLESFYRDIIKENNGKFKYHDGYSATPEKTKALANSIRWADVVLCPVDVNSHNACLGVKRLCKKWEKPYYMLHSSSVSSISNTLSEVARVSDN